jgi:tetratricopeptide (TPR) repeat protein
MKITPAARTVITPATAIRNSTSCSISNRWSRIRRNAAASEAGIAPLEQAIRLAPDGPNVAIAYWALGTCQLLLGRMDQAIDLLQTASAANPRLWVPYLYLAGAYGLRGDLDKAKSALTESIRLKPAIKSLARMQAENRWLTDPRYQALQVKTLNVGLRRAGFPDQ